LKNHHWQQGKYQSSDSIEFYFAGEMPLGLEIQNYGANYAKQ